MEEGPVGPSFLFQIVKRNVEVGVLDMARVPRYRNSQLEMLRSGRQKAIIVGGMPVPADEVPLAGEFGEASGVVAIDEGDVIDGEPVLVRALERSRFRDAFGYKVSLPEGVAVSLEDLEQGLRLAGLVGPDEIICQRGKAGNRFRVAKRQVAMDGHLLSSVDVERLRVVNAPQTSAVVNGAQSRALPASRHRKSRF